ncbi:MAG: flagellar hook assembly protein FlgD [Deltaproteobacteria bacterium]|nr:MAG: flagellar hook assembly protein FlgD [Deltaproteobacteria bacterium]TMB55064.1 MAG: flagellar hook assembly protein FlgD [Deltaproteobacteria bacterium]
MSLGGVSSTLLQNVTATATPGGVPKNQAVDQKQFLQLFIAQLQHQDPLSPLEPDQLTAQLAQFSQLEQLTGVNDRLDKLAGQSKDSGGAALLNLLGKRVSFDGSTLVVQGGKTPTVRYTVPESADKVTATVRSSDGTAVRVVDLGAQGTGQHTFAFDGKGALGTVLPDGSYRLEIAASKKGQTTPTSFSLLTEATVDGVDLTADPPALLVGGNTISFDQVRQVHQNS